MSPCVPGCDHVSRVRLYYGHSTGVVAGLLVRLAQAHGELGDSERADHYFGEADKIYRVVPGVKHPFYYEVSEYYPLGREAETLRGAAPICWNDLQTIILISAGFSAATRAIFGALEI